jgi:hypothetical protein
VYGVFDFSSVQIPLSAPGLCANGATTVFTQRRIRAAFATIAARASRLRILVVRQSPPSKPNSRCASKRDTRRTVGSCTELNGLTRAPPIFQIKRRWSSRCGIGRHSRFLQLGIRTGMPRRFGSSAMSSANRVNSGFTQKEGRQREMAVLGWLFPIECVTTLASVFQS